MDVIQRVPAILSFVQAVDRGSFARAAAALGISPAAVSKNVASLEAALGVRLLHRTTRSLRLTDEGEAFVERARIALSALDDAVDAVAERRAEASGRVRMSCASHYGLAFVLPLLPELRRRHPRVQLELDLDDRTVDLIAGGYDIALRGGHRVDSSLVSRPVGRLRTVLVASPDYLATHGVPRTPDELDTHDHIAIRFLHGALSSWTFRGSDGGPIEYLPARAVLTVSSPVAAAEAAVRGMGIAQVGIPNAWPAIRDGALRVLMPDVHDAGSRAIALQYPHRALVAPRVRAVVDFLLESLGASEALTVGEDGLRAFAA